MIDTRAISLIMALRGQGITDQRVLSAIERTPREMFVDEPFETSAYDNTALPIACGQTISQPYIVALSSQELEVQPSHRVLEIGTGSGYQAAVLAQLCRMVYTVERHKPLLLEAQVRFKELKLHNVVTRHGDGFQGWPEQAPFDRILLTAAIPELPDRLVNQLKPGGILVAPVGQAVSAETNCQQLVKIIRTDEGTSTQTLIPVVFVPMIPGLPKGEFG
jgi:protein-L-isoaspartate(D-aspartate) O-methyltransferase